MKKQVKLDMMESIITMHQQLVSLEKKIDTLIGRPLDRPFERGQHGAAKQGRDHRERALYKAICADCNKECEVPFRPNQDRPVYCKECFSSRKAGGSFRADRDNRPAEKDLTQQRPFAKYQKKPAFKSAKSKKKGKHK